ncbi:hypothetical protein N0V84_007113 [Fusarium piperis]|uniref:SAP domain-containing protein n=1 Tax=Fusarium piperis TaxID=1435070 RepID=A0A9W8WAK3_9HYPO|nr:hypothetical protein N0V84_007113 [Fusarium piperis]
MAEYSSLKVPELKKLLAEKGLPQTGNKADLIARLQENDKKAESEAKPAENKEDEISYSDDEVPAEPAAAAAAAASTAAPAPAPEAPATEAAPSATEGAEEPAAEKPAETEAPAEPEKSYAIGLSSTAADDEAKKRAERAKRFGLEEDEDAKKRAERAKRFGLDEKELASTLDSALPERSRKRGRDRGDGEGNRSTENNRPGKRQSLDRRNDRRRGGRGGRGPRTETTRETRSRGRILDDPAEKAKAERRAARFAGN